MRIADLPPAKSSAARERLLETARRIFYAEGVNTVGVQRIIEEAGVTLATFYRHFPSKQDLILAYLQSVHDDFEHRATVAQQAAETPGDVLTSIGNNITAQLTEPGFRGCAFINAATEFQSPDGPIMRAVLAHRAWFYALVRDAFATAGHPQPDPPPGTTSCFATEQRQPDISAIPPKPVTPSTTASPDCCASPTTPPRPTTPRQIPRLRGRLNANQDPTQSQ